MFWLSPEWEHFFSHQSYGCWEEQHGVWAHWGRMLWGISEKEFHLGFEWTSRAQAHSWGCCQAHVLPPWLGFTSMTQSLIFHLPFILFFFYADTLQETETLRGLILSGPLSPAITQSVTSYRQFCLHLPFHRVLLGSWRVHHQHC